jgi:sugar (pentulose or hexulose) kinase
MVEVAIGIDLGTQGARVVAVNPSGALIAAAHQSLAAPAESLPAGWFEQDPLDWWRAVREALRQVVGTLPARSVVSGICVDSTSGTILAVDAQGEPLSPAVMYNDRRSEEQASRVNPPGGHQAGRFTSLGRPTLRRYCFKKSRPSSCWSAPRASSMRGLHCGKLSGDFSCSDSSNALKTGYDLLDLRWPVFIERNLGIPLARLPRVTLPGQPIGQVSRQAADETGLLPGTLVLAGATDGTAAQIASGAARPGDWNSTLGTTLVFKGISRELHLIT